MRAVPTGLISESFIQVNDSVFFQNNIFKPCRVHYCSVMSSDPLLMLVGYLRRLCLGELGAIL